MVSYLLLKEILTMTSWQLFISAVLDHRYPIKQKEQEILDLVSNLSLVRFAAEQTKSGARDSGFLYFHVGNLLVRIVRAGLLRQRRADA